MLHEALDLLGYRWRCILADPPWPETGGGGRGTGAHYETVPYDEIPALVLGSPVWRPERAFWFGCWTTKNSLPYAHLLMEAAGVHYVTEWTWIKENAQGEIRLGTGQYGRHGVEFLLWGKRGTIGREGDAWQKAQADFARPLQEHSRKPDFAYEQAAKVFPGPHLEMFARRSRPGWSTYGRGRIAA
jgi:N6-adenosine-specific RNA methylase IME4